MAPPAPLIALRSAAVGFGGSPLFADLSISLARGDKACLVGRNGSGKSTLLKALAGQQDLDRGELFKQPGTAVAYLSQDPTLPPAMSVAEFVGQTLGADADSKRHRVDAVLATLDLAGNALLDTLSGGEARRAALAQALVGEPDVLLLDEPTNHLDLPTITWLEQELARFRGALMVISHDRAFLAAVSSATYWLDRGLLKRLDKGFGHFEAWAETEREREERDRHLLDRKIKREEHWLQRGVTARRKRNQGRLTRLAELRRQRTDWLSGPGQAKLATAAADGGGKLVIEAENIAKRFTDASGQDLTIVRGFSTRIRRGDRIGIIGPNGAGKTTLLKLLTGELAPDNGRVTHGSNLATLYFDQRRESLDPEATPWQILVPGGGDSLMVGGHQRHVVSYLTDCLFDESQARQPIKSLSGGERNRLLLAKLFAQPGNLLLLDEPTNDLDMETLDLLLELLDDYKGTLLLVSHDRDFLDRLVTGVIALEGDGEVHEVVGGYSDYLRERRHRPATPAKPGPARKVRSVGPTERPRAAQTKLSYREQRELDGLPREIAGLETEIAELEAALADAGFYERDPSGFEATAARLEELRDRLAQSETRWLELEERREALAASAAHGT